MIKSTQKTSSRYLIVITQLFLCFWVLYFLPHKTYGQNLDVPYVPTPAQVVERMLEIADVQSSDYIIDLGSGDGRIVIAAAKRGASGHGIDLDPKRVAEAKENALKAGVDGQVMFKKENIFDTDFTEASVITMYLLPSINKKLRPELLANLRPGTKVVSHSFDMGKWKPDKEIEVEGNGTNTHDVYYWVIPASVHGSWTWEYNGQSFTMNVDQEFQEISVDLQDSNGNNYNIDKAKLQGKRISLQVSNGNRHYILSGHVEGNEINGVLQNHNGENKVLATWKASQ